MPTIDLNGTPTYQGEVMLLGWSENNRDGMTVRFSLNGAEEGDVHPFRGLGVGKHGQRFALVAVPITEQNEVAEGGTHAVATPQPEAEVREKPRRKFEYMSPSQQAGLLCEDAEFEQYLKTLIRPGDVYYVREANKPTAADLLRHVLKVKSRKDIHPNNWEQILYQFRQWQTTKRYEDVRR